MEVDLTIEEAVRLEVAADVSRLKFSLVNLFWKLEPTHGRVAQIKRSAAVPAAAFAQY